MTSDPRRRANLRTAWVLAGLAVFFGLAFFARMVWLGG